MALGAQPRSVVGLMLHGALTWAGGGIALGLLGAALATRLLTSFLFGVSPIDAKAYVASVVVLGVVAWLAGYIPARRATRVDPVVALREA